jgi:hypothetical protein
MASETEQLVVSLEARVTKFEKAFARASGAANENWTRIERRGKEGAKNLEGSFISAGQAAQKMTDMMGAAAKGDPTAAMKNWNRGLAEYGKQAGLTRVQILELGHVSRALIDELAAGQNPMRALAVESGRIGEMLGSGPGGVAGSLAAIGSSAARYLPAIAALGAAFAVFETAKTSVEHLNEVVEKADKAGISAPAWQAWINQANKLKLSVEDMEQAVQHAGQVLEQQLNPVKQNAGGDLAKRAGLLSDLNGSAAPSRQMIQDAQSVEQLHQAALQLVKDYIDASEELRKQGLELEANQQRIEAARVATEVWGDAGKKVAEGIENGSLNVDTFAQKSREAGQVWSDEIFAAQKRVTAEITAANEHLSAEMRPSLESIAALSLKVLSAWARIVDTIASGVGAMRQLMAGAQELRDMAAAKKDDTHGVPFAEAFGKYTKSKPAPQYVDAPTPVARPDDLDEKPSKGGGGRHSKAPKERADEVERYIKSLEKENATLAGEANAIGKSNIEKQKSIDLSKAEEAAKERGKALTDQERDSILKLAEAHAQLRQKIEDASKAEQEALRQREALKGEFKAFASTIADAFEKGIEGGEKFSKILRNIEQSLAKQMLHKAFQNAVNGLTDSLFPDPKGGGNGGGNGAGGLNLNSVFSGLGKMFNSGGNSGGNSSGGGFDLGAMFSNMFKDLHFADGGQIHGPGGPRDDRILAAVSSGEYVVNAASAAKHLSLLHAINSDRLPRFASGGFIGSSGGASAPASPPAIAVHNYAVGVKVTPQLDQGTVTLMIHHAIKQNNVSLPSFLAAQDKRSGS